MSYPAGIQLSMLTFNNPITFLGNDATSVQVTIRPTASVVWSATGQPLDDFDEIVTPEPGESGFLTAPFVNQTGFLDSNGSAFTNWAYVVTRTATYGGAVKSVTKNWQPLLGQNVVDFDNLSGGPIGTPVSVPLATVTSVAGETGVITADELMTQIAPKLDANLPARLSAASIDAGLATKISTSQRGIANGVATLDGTSKLTAAQLPAINYSTITGTVPTAALPPLAVINTTPVASQAAMLALVAQRGDIAIRTDNARTYVLSTDSPTILADWKEVLAAGQVSAVAGKTGVVSLVKADVGLANVDNTTDAAKPISTATATALAGKAATSHDHNWSDILTPPVNSLVAKPETSAPSTYPLGVSYMGVASVDGWLGSLANVTTVRTFAGRTWQIMVGKVDATTWMRTETDGDVWTPWKRFATDAVVTNTANGLMTAADKTKLDAATSAATPSAMVMRNSGGDSFFRRVLATDQPTGIDQLTRKDYVDSAIATKANTVHAHTLDEVTLSVIGANVNLNTMVTQGLFQQGLNANATLALNYPEAAAGLLEVHAFTTSALFVFQRYTVYAAGGGEIYWRSQYNAGTWTAWQQVASTAITTATTAGLMHQTYKVMLDEATSLPTGSALVKRSSNGFVDMPTPTATAHATNKGYVDGLVRSTVLGNNAMLDTALSTEYPLGITIFSTTDNGFPAQYSTITTFRSGIASRAYQTCVRSTTGETWKRVDVSGTSWSAWVKQATDAVATTSAAGLMSSADKTKLDGATSSSIATGNENKLLSRDAAGYFGVPVPTATSHPTRKDYVDAQVATKATPAYVDAQITAAVNAAQLRLAPTGAKGQTLDRRVTSGASITAIPSGTLRVSAMWLPAGTVVNSISYVSGSVGTAVTNRWFALYDVNRNQLGITADSPATTWTAGTALALPLTSAYTIPTDGVYYVGFMEAATTPTTLRGVISSSNPIGLAPIINGDGSTGLTTPASAPATLPAITVQGAIPFAYVS